jgi:hypothetical protein
VIGNGEADLEDTMVEADREVAVVVPGLSVDVEHVPRIAGHEGVDVVAVLQTDPLALLEEVADPGLGRLHQLAEVRDDLLLAVRVPLSEGLDALEDNRRLSCHLTLL